MLLRKTALCHLLAPVFLLTGVAIADTSRALPLTSGGVAWNAALGSPQGASFESDPGSFSVGSGSQGWTGRPVIKFDLSAWAGNLPAGETLQSAVLRLYCRNRQGSPAAVSIFHGRADNALSNTPSLFEDSAYVSTPAGWAASIPVPGWIEMDVTDLVAADLAQDGDPNAIISAFRLQQNDDLSISSNSIRYLIDRTSGSPARPPELVVHTTGPFVPPTPAPFSTSLMSPDGSLIVEIQQANLNGTANYPDQFALYYRVRKNGVLVIDWSPLGLQRADADFLSSFSLENETDRAIDESYPLLHGKASMHRDHANEKTLALRNNAGVPIEVIFRAFDDGIAFRYHMPGTGGATVLQEISGYRLPASSRMWIHPRQLTYERSLQAATVENLPNQRWGYLAMAEIPSNNAFLLFHETGVYETYAGAHLMGPSNRLFTISLPQASEGNGVGSPYPTSSLPWSTPWRVATIGQLSQVVESGITTDLAEPFSTPSPVDLSWIRPGTAAWSWYSQGTGSESLQYEYVNSAVEFGWDHILIDANWQNFPNAPQSIQDIVSYARARGIGVHLWYNSGGPIGAHTSNPTNGPVDLMLDPATRRAEMAKLQEWGVAGIKVDYMNGDKQERFAQYIGVLRDAMDYELMVNFHGSTLPRGWTRTYPNFMSTEAVRGAEYYKFTDAPPSGLDNVRFALIRNAIGPMDYTPITFAAALAQRSLSHAHELALSVVFESGIQHFADRADANPSTGYRAVFAQAPYVRDFLAEVPAAWDETRLLEGHPDSHVVIARRKEDTWYVGGINGSATGRDVTLVPASLTPLKGPVEIIRENTASSFQTQTSTDSTLQVPLAGNGGFVATLRPPQTAFYQFIKPLVADYTLRTPEGDLDGDGISNLDEYFFGTDPLSAQDGTQRLPKIVWADHHSQLKHWKRTGATVSEIVYEKSRDLSPGSWQPLENQTPITQEDGSLHLPLEDGEDRMFFRIRIRP